MNKRNVASLALAILCGLALLAHGALAQGTPAVEWWVFAGGGGPASASGVALNDTLGQPIVGPAGNGSLSLEAGYWYGAAAEYKVYLPLVLREYP